MNCLRRMKWKYGFVTYERAADAYRAIDCSSNNADVNSYDISFGGRRAFCREKYFDLGKPSASSQTLIQTFNHLTYFLLLQIDNTGDFYQLNAVSPKVEPNSFEVLLRSFKESLKG